ncbi:MAG: endonuclease [Mariniphaga sp.]
MTITKIWYTVVFICLSQIALAQPLGYYNGTENLTGEQLKSTLHEIINDHIDFSYYRSGAIINYTDADPQNPDNVILFYLQQSRNADLYGTGGDNINREHVWAKSHGGFSGYRPMDSDVHNLRPADASVNEDRGNKDFDNVQPNGTQHPEATDCWYTDSVWEPGPATKGQVARILFYMAVRYEGTDLETDLEVVDKINTYPLPQHGKLSTLLEWNNQYPPTDFERRRNERIFQIQQNRNPFVDNPEFANLIWNNKNPEAVQFNELTMTPENPVAGDSIALSLGIAAETNPDSVILFWGNAFDSKSNRKILNQDSERYTGSISFNEALTGEIVHFTLTAYSNNHPFVFRGSYLVPEKIDPQQITSIREIQGTGTETPLPGQKVIVSGRVTANFDNTLYIQDESSPRSGICIYNSLKTGNIGDSVVVQGTVTEYNTLTELTDIDFFYNYGKNQPVEPVIITTDQLNEDYEGMLVKLEQVSFAEGGSTVYYSSKSYSFTDIAGQGVLYSDRDGRLPGSQLPDQPVTLTGIVSQYKGTYQVLARDVTDLSIPTNAGLKPDLTPEIVIYPNPADNQLIINTRLDVSSIAVFSAAGELKLLHRGKQKVIDVSGLPQGMYLLKIETANGNHVSKKLVIQ